MLDTQICILRRGVGGGGDGNQIQITLAYKFRSTNGGLLRFPQEMMEMGNYVKQKMVILIRAKKKIINCTESYR